MLLSATKSGLELLTPPFIAHVATIDGENEGHFLVITKVDVAGRRVDAVDGTLATCTSFDYSEFLKRWTGSVLVLTPPSSAAMFGWGIAWLGAGLASGFLIIRLLGARQP